MSSSIALRRSPKPGALTAATFRPAAQLVDDERRERLALDILGDDQQRPRRLNDGLEDREQRLQVRQLLLVDQDVRVVELDRHLLGVGDEVRRQVAAVELHAFDDVELRGHALGFLDSDDAFLADLFHRLGDHVADFLLAVRRDGADLGDLGGAGDVLRAGLEVGDDGGDRHVDAALQVHRVHAGRDRLHALADDRLGEDGRGRRAVAGLVVGLRRDFADHLRAEVLELVLELDLLGDGDAVLGDARRAEALLDDDVAALGTERHLDRIGEDVDAAEDALTRVAAETDVFGCHDLNSLSN